MDIDKILLKVLNNQANKEEYEALEQWKSESEKNLLLLNELMSKQEGTELPYKSYDKDKAWKKVNAQIDTEPVSVSKPSSKLPFYLIGIVLLSIAAYLLYNKGGSTIQNKDKFYADVETMAFALEDNSNIWLREGGSTLKVISDFSEKERRVALTGEGFFDIAKDRNKPFIIELSAKDFIKVIGTSFNVINTEEDLSITVYSGKVELHTLDRVIELTKNDKVSRINGATVVTKNNDKHLLSWKTDELVFNNAGLQEVFDAISKHYKVNIQLDPSSTNLASCTIRTRYTNEGIDEVIKNLAQHFGFQFNIEQQNISISGLSCS